MNSRLLKILTSLILTLCGTTATASIAVLDINDQKEDDSFSQQAYSATYMCDIAGYEYLLTQSLEDAMNENVILLANLITATSFTEDEFILLKQWIEEGGVLVAPAITGIPSSCKDIVAEIFGIDAAGKLTQRSNRPIIRWNPDHYGDKELEYMDEDHERDTSIGEIRSYTFTPDTCDVLASYSTGEAAVARNILGKGTAYTAGISWLDVIERNQLNKDKNSSRQYNNGFEPSADIWSLFLRSIHAKAMGLSVWKFTVPAGYTQLLIPTHDCDSRTAYDEMHFMSEYEQSIGLKGHYFLTTHYFSDKINFGHSYLSDFYNQETLPKAARLLEEGHTIGSHSICHFPDFNKTRNTDVVTREEYAHRATCEDGKSTGASTWAEIVMSKQILEEDLGNTVRSFRSGHLCVNPDFHAMLEEGNYSFQSCYTGGDLLSEFPFFGRHNNDWNQEKTRVLTMQLHISDVYNNKADEPLNNDTWESHRAPDDWENAMQKLRGNYASAILLIHPNREWKMILQKKLIDRLDLSEVGLYNFEDYGDFWISRLNNKYSYTYNEEDGQLTIITDSIEELKKSRLTYAIETDEKPVISVVVTDNDANEIYDAKIRKLSESRYLAIPDFGDSFDTAVDQINNDSADFSIIYDINGRRITSFISNANICESLPKGIYIVKTKTTTKKIII